MSTETSGQRPRVGFIGLGAMGAPMAARVAQGGFPLTVFDANAERAAALAAETGCRRAETLADLGSASDVIVTMLPSSDVVATILENGLLDALKPGALILEMSSGVPERTRQLADEVAARGGQLIDAPVSGGVARARSGDLAIMVGGDDEACARAQPLLQAMGSALLRTGGVGTAHAMKALNNLVSAGGFLIGIEALLIGSRYGLDPAVMVDVLNASTGMNNSTQKKFKQFVLSRRFDAGFGLDLMVKDLGIALGVAEEVGAAAPFSALCREIWAGARAYLGPGQDHTAMARFSELMAGGELTFEQPKPRPPSDSSS